MTLIGEIAGRELVGIVTGIALTIFVVGGIIGPPAFGYTVDITGSYQLGWQLLAIVAIVAAVLLFFVREGKRQM